MNGKEAKNFVRCFIEAVRFAKDNDMDITLCTTGSQNVGLYVVFKDEDGNKCTNRVVYNADRLAASLTNGKFIDVLKRLKNVKGV